VKLKKSSVVSNAGPLIHLSKIGLLHLLKKLYGEVNILEPNEIKDEQVLVTVSVVGSQAAQERYLKPTHLVRAIEILKENGVKVDGLIACEIGGINSVNGSRNRVTDTIV